MNFGQKAAKKQAAQQIFDTHRSHETERREGDIILLRLVIQTLLWFCWFFFFLFFYFFIQLSLDIINFHPIRTLEGAAQHAVPRPYKSIFNCPKMCVGFALPSFFSFLEASTFHKQVAKLYFIFFEYHMKIAESFS